MSWLFGEISSGTTPDSRNLDYYGSDVNWVTTGELRERGIAGTEKQLTMAALAAHSALKIYPPGTLLIAMYGATIGRLGWLEAAACTNQACCALSSPIRVVPRFAYYVLTAARKHLVLLASGGGQPNINQDKLRGLRIGVPSPQEQESIVRFLDYETAKIDALIAKQEQLIATLREDRTATITHAVTKGLDPDVEMKDSGVEWIGEVPVHWSVPQIGMHAVIGNGSTPARDERRYWYGGTLPWLNSSHVNNEEITEADQYVTDVAFRECHLPMVSPGSVLVGLTGQGKTRGMASMLLVKSTINQHLAYITPIDRHLDGRYIQRVLASAYGLLRELSDENGSTKGGLTCAALRKVRTPLPPVVEQHDIVEHVQKKCSDIDALTAKATRVIGILREYRSALITDAVTGKIDVRGAA